MTSPSDVSMSYDTQGSEVEHYYFQLSEEIIVQTAHHYRLDISERNISIASQWYREGKKGGLKNDGQAGRINDEEHAGDAVSVQ